MLRYSADVTVSRLLIVTLALFVSPLGAAVCEIACGSPTHAAAHGAPAPSAAIAADRHLHHQAESDNVVAAPAPAASRVDALPEAGCEPVSAAPARIRAVFSDTPALAHAGVGASAAWTTIVFPHHPAVKSPPSSPPHHVPVPLRI